MTLYHRMLIKSLKLISTPFLSVLSHQSLFYVLIKYLDLFFLSYLFFAFAKLVGPTAYGNASIGFIFISYSTLLMLGLNQVFIRRYSLLDHENKVHFSYYNLLYSASVGAITFIVAILFINEKYSCFVGLICFSKILQDATITINRAKERAFLINITMVLFSAIFIVLFLLKVSDTYDFFLYWSVSALISCVFGLYSIRELFRQPIKGTFNQYIKENFSSLFKEGLMFSLYTILFIAYSSTDRLLLLRVAQWEYVGNYQLADNIASAVTAGLGALWYISMPNINSKLQKGLNYRKFIKAGTTIVFSGLICLILILIPCIVLSSFIFKDYQYLSEPLFLLIVGKYIGVGLSIPSAIYFAFSKWNIYTKYFFWAVFIDTILILLAAYSLDESTLMYTLPIIHLVINLIFYVFIYDRIYNRPNSFILSMPALN